MGFFDDLRLPGGDEDEDDYSTPEWLAAPDDFIAGVVPVELVLARSEEAAVSITRIAAYSVGFEFDAELVTRKPTQGDHFELMYDPDRPSGELPPELVRLGVAFADGRRTTSLGSPSGGSTMTALLATDEDESPPDPAHDILMTAGRGGGSPRHSTSTYWVWPLPPPGPVTFACEWPEFGIDEATAELDAALVIEAAARSRAVWSE
jgi:hypothetical protein